MLCLGVRVNCEIFFQPLNCTEWYSTCTKVWIDFKIEFIREAKIHMRWGFLDSSTCELSFVLHDPPWRALLQSSVSDVYVCAGCKHQASHWPDHVRKSAGTCSEENQIHRHDSWSDAKFLFRVEAESAPVPSNKVQIDRCILWSGASYGCFEDQEKHRRGLRTPCIFDRPQNHSQRLTCAQS